MSQPYINPTEATSYAQLQREEEELERDKGRFAKQGGQVPSSLNIPRQSSTSFSNQLAVVPDEPPIDATDCGDTVDGRD